MKVDCTYWNTFYEYLNRDEFKFNGDVKHDAKIVCRTYYLWQNASKKYLKKVTVNELTDMWVDCRVTYEIKSYEGLYKEFIDYLHYATDRMNLRRWLFLQLVIIKAKEMVYNKFCEEYNWKNWSGIVLGGFIYDSLSTVLKYDSKKEWKETILPLIKAEKGELKIKNEIQN